MNLRAPVTAVAVAVALAACAPSATTSRGTSIPATRVRGLDRSETALSAVAAGRPALVSLWATWCDACRDEVPALQKADAWAQERGGIVIGVAVGEPIAKVASFAAEKRLPYLVLVDEEFVLADALGEKRVPTTLVVDRAGRIVHVGGVLDDRALAAFEKLFDTPAAQK